MSAPRREHGQHLDPAGALWNAKHELDLIADNWSTWDDDRIALRIEYVTTLIRLSEATVHARDKGWDV